MGGIMKCLICGTENDPSNQNCIRCNTKLPKRPELTFTVYFWIIGIIVFLLLLLGGYSLIIEPRMAQDRVLNVGKWYFISGTGNFQNLQFEIQFNRDGTCLVKTPQIDQVSIQCSFIPIKKIRFIINGIVETATYSCDGRNLYLNFNNSSYVYQNNPGIISTPINNVQNTSTPRPGCVSRDGGEMIQIPASEFQMGAIDGDKMAEKDEKPRHTVYTDSYCIDKTEVTNKMFIQCVNAGACSYQSPVWINPTTGSDRKGSAWPEYPAIYVNWENTDNYCRWAGERLPTEAEWEKAARGTHTDYLYPWGNDLPDPPRANFAKYFGNTREVGSMPGGNSFWKVQDLAGNVWEWVADWYKSSYPAGKQTNPTGPSTGTVHVLRGGSWAAPLKDIRITSRSYPLSQEQEILGSGNWGFRCAMDAN
jgi:formylglycine-generating enzyme required for sulfatase activity